MRVIAFVAGLAVVTASPHHLFASEQRATHAQGGSLPPPAERASAVPAGGQLAPAATPPAFAAERAPADPAGGAPVDPAASQAPGDLTLAAARAAALASNPDLAARAAEVRASEQATRQARAWRNPELAWDVENLGARPPADAAIERTLSLVQSIEWPGARAARLASVADEREVAARDLDRRRRDLITEVERRFATLLGAQERLVIGEENLRTAREVTAAVTALVAGGEVSPIEQARARADEALAAIDLAAARRDLAAARRDLALAMGDAAPSFARAAGILGAAESAGAARSGDEGLATLPEVARWDAEIARRTSLLDLARRRAAPDIAITLGTRSYGATAGHGYVAGIALPLPVFDRSFPARAEAAVRLEQARFERRAEVVRVDAARATAAEAVTQAGAETRALRDEVLPNAEKVYDAINEGYRRGKFRLLDLLEARRTLAAVRLRTVDALVRLDLAAADLRRFDPDARDDHTGDAR